MKAGKGRGGLSEKTEQQYKNEIVRQMKALNVYRKEFSHTVVVLARMLYDYDEALRKFEDTGGSIVIKHTNKTGAVNAIKNPYYQTIEGLRISILSYARELGLTPAGLKKINDASMQPTKGSKLADALLSLSGQCSAEKRATGTPRKRKAAARSG
ncbi:MAG: P27 family phage terminase small subunit [Eubacteriales bacterium]|nr:P27 family phage terminase small subunit [Eubacteriales bacterium]